MTTTESKPAKLPDYSGVMSLLPLTWEADEDAFRYLLDKQMDSIVDALEGDGVPLDSANIAALHEDAWAHRAKMNRSAA